MNFSEDEMESKKRYKTKQYDELVEYISSIPGQHFTVNELYVHFAGKDKAIGVTTLYRHLQRMLDEGIVSKYAVGTNGAACFEYVGDGAPHEGAPSSRHSRIVPQAAISESTAASPAARERGTRARTRTSSP